METTDAVTALSALAQDNRLDVFRLLVQSGPDGMQAGAIAEALDLAPNTLTFHFDRLRMAGRAQAGYGSFDEPWMNALSSLPLCRIWPSLGA